MANAETPLFDILGYFNGIKQNTVRGKGHKLFTVDTEDLNRNVGLAD